MSGMAQITGASVVCSTICSVADQRKIKAPCQWPLWGESSSDQWFSSQMASYVENALGLYTKGRLLVKSNLICPDKLSWQPGCSVLNINIKGNFCISQGNGSSDKLPENLV